MGGYGGGGDGGGGEGGGEEVGKAKVSFPVQPFIESGSYVHPAPALQIPKQSEQMICSVPATEAFTGQNVPKRGSVNPPELGHVQSFCPLNEVGAVVHTVAASFHA
jgi:hypothetical protein